MPSEPVSEAAIALIKTDESKVLGLSFGGKAITPGEHVPKASKEASPTRAKYLLTTTDAKSPPEISLPSATGTYIIACIDLDAPFISFSFMAPILHWVQSDFKADSSGVLTSSSPEICFYAGPGPPPGAAPHRYVFLLYGQSADFDTKKHLPAKGKKFGMSKRTRFNWATYEKELGLGPVLAANWFVSN
jgi:phosphatidylethanolamine-binding protein (PEBP) family uncharacterized protein